MINRLKFFLLGLASVVALTGCFGTATKVSFLEFTLLGQGVEEGEVIGTTMRMVPDYEARTIFVSYKEDFSDEKQEDVLVEGTLGGEKFDRFEKSVKLIEENETMEASTDVFSVQFTDMEAKEHYFMQTSENVEVLDELNMFYFDVLNLLTGEEQV